MQRPPRARWQRCPWPMRRRPPRPPAGRASWRGRIRQKSGPSSCAAVHAPTPAPSPRRVRRARWPARGAGRGAPGPGPPDPPGPVGRGHRPAARCPSRGGRCVPAGRARAGTSAGSPSTAGGQSCRVQPRPPRPIGPRTRRGRSAKGCPGPARRAAWASAASPCAPWWPRGPRSPAGRRHRPSPPGRGAAKPPAAQAPTCRRPRWRRRPRAGRHARVRGSSGRQEVARRPAPRPAAAPGLAGLPGALAARPGPGPRRAEARPQTRRRSFQARSSSSLVTSPRSWPRARCDPT